MNTKNFYFLLLLSFLVFTSVFTQTVYGQELNQRWVCLDGKRCNEEGNCSQIRTHSARLTVKPGSEPLADKETFIIECIATAEGQICTSGFNSVDEALYGSRPMETLAANYQYVYQGMYDASGDNIITNPLPPNQNALLQSGAWSGAVEWADETPEKLERKFLAMNFVTADTGGGGEVGTGGQQQGTFDFETAGGTDCVAIAWDPYGVVFDSNSLEPIPQAKVSLLKKRDSGEFTLLQSNEVLGGVLINPQFVKSDGGYSFAPQPGVYKLDVQQDGYSYPSSTTLLNANYSKAYSDIYRGEEFEEVDKALHFDIPLEPGAGVSGDYPVELLQYFYESNPINNTLVISGTTSHPLTKVIAYSRINNPDGSSSDKQLTTTIADKRGKFTIIIYQNHFSEGEVFDRIVLQKVNLNQAPQQTLRNRLENLFISLMKTVSAAQMHTKIIRFDPIPSYLEGYAYDKNLNIIPFANVGVYLKFANKPYSQVKADAQGYFKITTNKLPTMPYNIVYQQPGKQDKVTVSTSQFITQNKNYIAKNNVNLNQYVNAKGQVIAQKEVVNPVQASDNISPTQSAFAISQTGVRSQDSEDELAMQEKESVEQSKSSMISFTVFLILLISATVVFVVFYFNKKNKSSL